MNNNYRLLINGIRVRTRQTSYRDAFKMAEQSLNKGMSDIKIEIF